MELHVSGLSPETTANSLKNFLRRELKPYGIVAFECKKPKGKRYGFVTLPYLAQGQKFMNAYRLRQPFYFHGHLIFKPATQAADSHAVEALRRRQQDNIDNQHGDGAQTKPKNKFQILGFSCGTICFFDGKLSFIETYRNASPAVALFGKRGFTLTTPPYDPKSSVQSSKLDFRYASIEKVLTEDGVHGPVLTIHLFCAPKVIHLKKAADDLVSLLQSMNVANADKPHRVRGVDQEHGDVMAQCLAYRMHVHPAEVQRFKSFLAQSSNELGAVRYPLHALRLNDPWSAQLQKLRWHLAWVSKFDFATRFQLQRLAQNCYLMPWTVQELERHMAQLPEDKAMSQTVRRMFRKIPFAGPDSEPSDFRTTALLQLLKDSQKDGQTGVDYALARRHAHLFLIHQATVTPSGVYLEGPELVAANRVLRKYAQFAETHFLRVKFVDEDGDAIRFDRVHSLEKIHRDWFRDLVLGGTIDIADQKFGFLGFSNSSLKDQACWFMADFRVDGVLHTPWYVVKQLGDFSKIHSPAKCAARIGQAFSDTHGGAVDTTSTILRKIPDKKTGDRVFSDGCGTVSRQLLRKIWKTYRRNVHPTCFQVRYAGAKGMISLDSRLDGEVLCIRDSMLKFNSHDDAIEICDASRRPLPFFLNRQLIKILEDLQVPEGAFMDLQKRAVDTLRQNVSSPSRAADFLERFNVGKGCSLSWLIHRLAELHLDCFEDIFLRTSIEHAVLMQLRLIKHKARIFVEDGYTLFGIMDETGCVGEGEVVCLADGEIMTGPVTITRSPALHPGDVQMATAIDVLQGSPLRELDNCVIFSQFGQRDLPSQLSGGDLDGDLYNVIFDKTLRPKRTFLAADYPRATAVDLYRPMEPDDIKDWFIKFMQNDQLSRIALAHQQLADHQPTGTCDPLCLKLAALHSTAVDFQKTGISIDQRDIPRLPKSRPDFMAPDPRLLPSNSAGIEAFDKLQEEGYIPSEDENDPDAAIDPDADRKPGSFYQSNKILGKLYRAVDEHAFLEELEANHRKIKRSSVVKKLFDHVKRETQGLQWEHLIDWAWEVREEYEEQVVDYMLTYSPSPRKPLSEVEVFTGDIIGKGGSLPSRQVRENSRTMKDRFNDAVHYIIRRIIYGNDDPLGEDAEFDVDANWADTSHLRDEALERSIACLYVSLEKGEFWPSVGRSLESFQYVAGKVALRECDIFTRRNATNLMGVEILNFT